MVKLKLLVLLFFLIDFHSVKANDTLFIHPNYPAIVLNKAAYNYYVYTPKYIPSSLFHAFEILATCTPRNLASFKRLTIDD
ncbi:hypothetical protein [Crocinitomix catalasitica]|uniref:hypothetical protein n=1 Tax=Crocinitomix catalasitica TaxID=184607 RepID=UPI0004860087|nr:hypothetical protein [Crocinitomix catalasitica]